MGFAGSILSKYPALYPCATVQPRSSNMFPASWFFLCHLQVRAAAYEDNPSHYPTYHKRAFDRSRKTQTEPQSLEAENCGLKEKINEGGNNCKLFWKIPSSLIRINTQQEKKNKPERKCDCSCIENESEQTVPGFSSTKSS